MYQRTMHGPIKPAVRGFKDLSKREMAYLSPLLAVIIVLGVYPKPLLDIITPAVNATMSDVGADQSSAQAGNEGGD